MNTKASTGRKATNRAAHAAKKTTTRRTAAKTTPSYNWNADGKPNAKTRAAIVATFAALRDAIADHATEKESVAAYERGRTANADLAELMRAAGLDAAAMKADFGEIEARLLGEDPATAYRATPEEIVANVDAAASNAAKVYGNDAALASMFAAVTVEESDEPTQPGVFVMTVAPDFTHAGMFATALAAQIFTAGHVLTEAIPYGEMKAEDGSGHVVSWYIENRRHVSTAQATRKA